MADDLRRSRQARLAAERALVRVVHHYGEKPEFVVLGGLVPELLCSSSTHQHAGTTDIDVQVDLEIKCNAVNTVRLERALRNAEFEPAGGQAWRWRHLSEEVRAEVKFELLADLDSEANSTVIRFDGCKYLGAVNLRGSRYATRDVEPRTLTAKVGEDLRSVEINVTGVAGFLLTKCAAAHSRRKPKDWYDIAFVLLHNDLGGPKEAARAVVSRFGREALESSKTALADLAANFTDIHAQGPIAYADQFLLDHPEFDRAQAKADAIAAVAEFLEVVANSGY